MLGDPDARIRDAVRAVPDALLLPREEASTDATEGGARTPLRNLPATLRDESEPVFALFNEYVAKRTAPPYKPGQANPICSVASYLNAREGYPGDDVGEIEGEALEAVRSIASFLGVPNSSATVKSLCFQEARGRVAKHEALIAGPRRSEWGRPHKPPSCEGAEGANKTLSAPVAVSSEEVPAASVATESVGHPQHAPAFPSQVIVQD